MKILGTYSANHQEHFIKFKWQGERYKLYGFQPPRTQIVSSHKMEKLIRKGAPAYVVQCREMELLTSEVVKPSHSEIQGLIQKYKKYSKTFPWSYHQKGRLSMSSKSSLDQPLSMLNPIRIHTIIRQRLKY